MAVKGGIVSDSLILDYSTSIHMFAKKNYFATIHIQEA